MSFQTRSETQRVAAREEETGGLLERYRLLFERSGDAIWFLSEDYRFVEVNQSAVDLYGYSREEFAEMRLHDLRQRSTLKDLEKQFDLAKSEGTRFETLHVKKDGTVFPVDVSAIGVNFKDSRIVLAIVRDISAMKQSEEALRESEERRKLAEEAGQVGIWDWDAETQQTYWSETMYSFYGGSASEPAPTHDRWLELLHPSDRERLDVHVTEALESEASSFRDEFRVVRSDGSVRWLESSARIVRGQDGKALRMYGVNLDVTDRKDTEERIRLSENQLRLVTNAIPALISYVDSSERFRFVNQQFNDLFGLGADEIVGQKIREVLGSSAYKLLKPKLDEALAGKQVTFETPLTHKRFGTRYVHLSLMPDIGLDGTVYGFYGLTNDLTALKRSQDLLRSTEEQMAKLVENVPDYAIFSTDRKGVIDRWNTGAELIFGYTAEEMIGRSAEVLFTAEDIEKKVPIREMRIARQKGRFADDRWLQRKGGARFFASGVLFPLNVGNQLKGYAMIASDLTEKQRQAEELQRAHDELEVRVRDRTRELAQANLALVQEMQVREVAEKQRIELLGRLVTSQESERRRIARDLHDHLGQRLTALRLKIASLKELAAEHPQIAMRVARLHDIGEAIDAEVSHLAWQLRPSVLDDLGLTQAVRTVVNQWSRHYEIPAEFHSTGLSNVRLNRDVETHLYRIVQEALNNIVKHAEATFATVLLEKRGDDVILIVEDNGKGFDTSVERDMSDPDAGLGLIGIGERATLIGGDLEVESAPKRGTTIYVRAPIRDQATDGN